MKKLSEYEIKKVLGFVILVVLFSYVLAELHDQNLRIRKAQGDATRLKYSLIDLGILDPDEEPEAILEIEKEKSTVEHKEVKPKKTVKKDINDQDHPLHVEGPQFVMAFAATERAFDPAILDFYAEDVLIVAHRERPDGSVTTLELTKSDYAQLVHAGLPIAEAMGDVNRYSVLSTNVIEDDTVYVETHKYNERKAQTTKHNFAIKKFADGKLLIIKEEGGLLVE